MLRRESDSHGLFSSGETSDNDCEVSFLPGEPSMARTFSFLQVDLVGRYAAASLIIALMVFTRLSESRGFIGPRNLTVLHFQHFQRRVGVKG